MACTHMRSGVIAPPLLALTLDGGEQSTSQPCHFNPREKAPNIPWIGSWVGSRGSLDAVDKTNLALTRTEPGPYILQHITILPELSGLLFLMQLCAILCLQFKTLPTSLITYTNFKAKSQFQAAFPKQTYAIYIIHDCL